MSFLNFFKSFKPSKELWDALEDILIQGDIGPHFSIDLVQRLSQRKWEKGATLETLQYALAHEIEALLTPFSIPLSSELEGCILIVGVNGSGKTTTIAKLGRLFPSVAFVAADTFRAAATEQLQIWADRLSIPLYAKQAGFDPAALVHETVLAAHEKVLIIDTAGRLQTQNNLMDEVSKIKRVLSKAKSGEPKECLLVLDGTVGQNALSQAERFHNCLQLTGLILTKYDGTARGGVVLNLVSTYKIPIRGVTFGESPEDFAPLDPKIFAQNLVQKITS